MYWIYTLKVQINSKVSRALPRHRLQYPLRSSINNLIALMTVHITSWTPFTEDPIHKQLATAEPHAAWRTSSPRWSITLKPVSDRGNRQEKAVYNIPAITHSGDQSEEQGKRLKLDTKDGDPAQEHNTDSDYNKALALLRSNTPEQILDVQLPYSKYLQLEKAFSTLNPDSDTAAEKSYPSLSYDSCTETVTVVTVPSNVHEAGVDRINREIVRYDENYLSTHSPQLVDSIGDLGSTTMRGFHGPFAKCVKQPDGGVIYVPPQGKGEQIVTVVVEVGASERYKKLCRDKDIWIDGLGVKVFILVCITESPQFRRPSTEYEHIEDVGAEIALMKETFIEVWRPDGNPSRYDLIDNDHTCDHLLTTLGLHISDLFPDDVLEAADIPDQEIPFNARRYRAKLMTRMKVTAHMRFVSFIEQKELEEDEEE
ncbi:hypothetical protein V1504DRAFT_440523 [Lipomyces starkeyi]